MKSNAADFVRDRPLRLGAEERFDFFQALRDVALNFKISNEEDDRFGKLESIHLNDHVMNKLKFVEGKTPPTTKKILADLILIGLDINQQYVSAISINYRKASKNEKRPTKRRHVSVSKTLDKSEAAVNSYSVKEVCTCGTAVHCQSSKHLRLNIILA